MSFLPAGSCTVVATTSNATAAVFASTRLATSRRFAALSGGSNLDTSVIDVTSTNLYRRLGLREGAKSNEVTQEEIERAHKCATERLERSSEAAQNDIENAHQLLIERLEAERAAAATALRNLQEAYDTLSDPVKRRMYDTTGQAASRASKARAQDRDNALRSALHVVSKLFLCSIAGAYFFGVEFLDVDGKPIGWGPVLSPFALMVIYTNGWFPLPLAVAVVLCMANIALKRIHTVRIPNRAVTLAGSGSGHG
jgi:hypothetical protein